MAEPPGSPDSEDKRNPWRTFALVEGLVLVVWAAYAFIVVQAASLSDWQTRGQFGDAFGALNALFSGMAFAAFVVALMLQRQELGLQRRELQLQREEMAASRVQLERQANVQAALARVTVAQIRVVAEQVRVEALKMDAEMNIPAARTKWVSQIRDSADNIIKIANEFSIESA